MNATPNAIAHALPHAMCETSAHAKRSEVKSPDLTSPDMKFCGYSKRQASLTYRPAPDVLTLAGETNG